MMSSLEARLKRHPQESTADAGSARHTGTNLVSYKMNRFSVLIHGVANDPLRPSAEARTKEDLELRPLITR